MENQLKLQLTPHSLIWTGDIERQNNSLLTTGLKGSLRWWYETLIRGFSVYSCDPTEGGCTFKFERDLQQQIDSLESLEKKTERIRQEVKKQICPACYLFGCTGWKSRFGFLQAEVSDPPSGDSNNISLQKGNTYSIELKQRFGFPMEGAELFLLKILFNFISRHGSICGLMGRKPSEGADSKNSDTYKSRSHVDYGLCSLALGGADITDKDSEQNKVLKDFRAGFTLTKTNHKEWPDFRYLWYTNIRLNRDKINKMVKRNPNYPKKYQLGANRADPMDEWMGGNSSPLVSKKIFAFHGIETKGLNKKARVWGYVRANQEGKNWITKKLIPDTENLKWGTTFLSEQGVQYE